MRLIPVGDKDLAAVEWLRINRNDPRLYKYFRQDKPITEDDQKKWWRGLNKNTARLFIVEVDILGKSEKVGSVGFNPFSQRAMSAEFGVFILTEHQGKGYGTKALYLLLKKGFEEYGLRTIYSDVLDYPGEDRFKFYQDLGFVKFPECSQNMRYKKQGNWISSIKFYMHKEIWDSVKERICGLGYNEPETVSFKSNKNKKGPSVHSGKGNLQPVS